MLIIANTFFQQCKKQLYTCTHQMVNTEIRLIMFFASKDGEALYSQQKQDLELTVAQSFRYDLNQIPHDYTVQVTNRFRGLDLIECLKN